MKYGLASRIDILLDDPSKGLAYVEIKNVHLSRQSALPSSRIRSPSAALKHLVVLSAMVAAGHRAVMLYPDPARRRGRILHWRPTSIPGYAEAFDAAQVGVEAIAYACHLTPRGDHVCSTALSPLRIATAKPARLEARIITTRNKSADHRATRHWRTFHAFPTRLHARRLRRCAHDKRVAARPCRSRWLPASRSRRPMPNGRKR